MHLSNEQIDQIFDAVSEAHTDKKTDEIITGLTDLGCKDGYELYATLYLNGILAGIELMNNAMKKFDDTGEFIVEICAPDKEKE